MAEAQAARVDGEKITRTTPAPKATCAAPWCRTPRSRGFTRTAPVDNFLSDDIASAFPTLTLDAPRYWQKFPSPSPPNTRFRSDVRRYPLKESRGPPDCPP